MIMKPQEMRDQSIEELVAKLEESKRELFELKNEMKRSKKLEKPHLLREKKKDIAKFNTIIREKQLANR
ncbi:50S ribosomal protein L29 [Waddlia chondrophila WSU 86-1044]|uniref:Large ribosomal subunit protein uL29 n=2 Tax=Waddlia chondrophila TaxID=71667 RepID=D6YRZ8_WADCW|nr:50S ribosomal protein L29 [Waddlia chondrophila WSU 86-1044]